MIPGVAGRVPIVVVLTTRTLTTVFYGGYWTLAHLAPAVAAGGKALEG
jgi:hypothetical protein